MNHRHHPALSDLSALRIGGWSTALALHALGFGLLVLPPRAPQPDPAPPRAEVLIAQIIARVVPTVAPAPPIPPPPRRPPPPRTQSVRTPVAPPSPVVEAEPALPVAASAVAPATSDSTPEPGPPAVSRGAQIAYRHAPAPPYPTLARRRGWEGLVLLRVRVDVQGTPQEVLVETSSGHALLDRSAREHVLKRWRFQPAMLDGVAVPAWAQVPVSFRIEAG